MKHVPLEISAVAQVSHLPEWAEALLRTTRRSVVPCQWQGSLAFIKRRTLPRKFESALLPLLAPLLRRWMSPNEPFTPAPLAVGIVEVSRLRALRELGVRVPRVLAVSESAFVIESSGTTLHNVLLVCSREDRQRLVLEAAADLAAFHRGGHWHGGAEIRNIAVSPEGMVRFDFERDLDRYLPLALLQALDTHLFFASLSDIDDLSLISRAAQCYLAQAQPQVLRLLKRNLGLTDYLARSRLIRKLAPKEAKRARTVALALDGLRN